MDYENQITKVVVIKDSLNEGSANRITTFKVTLPRIVLPELRTHRMIFSDDGETLRAYSVDLPTPVSMNAMSSRATPVKRFIKKMKEGYYFVPKFRMNAKGMQPGEWSAEETNANAAHWWNHAYQAAVEAAEAMHQIGISKEIANRVLEPYMFVDVLLTATEWKNFLMLRTHPDAQYEIRLLALEIEKALRFSSPTTIRPGQWHLPYMDTLDMQACQIVGADPRKVSAARCARISILSFTTGDKSTIEEDLALFDKLAGSIPKHLSPLEHPARCDGSGKWHANLKGWQPYRSVTFPVVEAGGDNIRRR